MSEAAFIASLRALAAHPFARGLQDDAAVLDIGGQRLVLTHDMIVEGVHFLPTDPPGDVAWKLVAVNLSDLAAKGATPIGVLLGYTLGTEDWNAAFTAGLGEALAAFDVPLLGGDTVAGGTRAFGLTAIGRAAGPVPSRSGAQAGDRLFVTGTIGDAGLGLQIASGARRGPDTLLARYRRPWPRLAEGTLLAPHVSAMMDVSDGLLIDASRLAEASGLATEIVLDLIPLSPAFIAMAGDGLAQRLAAATAGDDYELLFAAAAPLEGVPCREIGRFAAGIGLALSFAGAPIELPPNLGFEHRGP